ncbi:MAG: hypothetical protein EBR30_05865 [Cytophagia bacterium]|nr:hypothetical protein [Cytophagia bacterium]
MFVVSLESTINKENPILYPTITDNHMAAKKINFIWLTSGFFWLELLFKKMSFILLKRLI